MKMKLWMPVAAWFSVLAACDSSEPPKEVPLTAIESETIAVVCDAKAECGCEPGSAQSCRELVRAVAADIRGGIGESGLSWDPACLGYVLERIEATGCGGSLDHSPADACAPVCNYLHGSRAVGEQCQQGYYDSVEGFPGYGGITDCAQGLVCSDGVCVEPCGQIANDPRGGVGQPCDNGCRTGLTCDWETYVCQELPREGQLCVSGQCEPGTFCEFEDPNDTTTPMICKAPIVTGQSCRGHQQCESGYCPNGFCATLPEEGESCRGTSVCAPGLDCRPEDQVCVKGSPVICELRVPLPSY